MCVVEWDKPGEPIPCLTRVRGACGAEACWKGTTDDDEIKELDKRGWVMVGGQWRKATRIDQK